MMTYEQALAAMRAARERGDQNAELKYLNIMRELSAQARDDAAFGLTVVEAVDTISDAVADALIEAPSIAIRGTAGLAGDVAGSVISGFVNTLSKNPVLVIAAAALGLALIAKK